MALDKLDPKYTLRILADLRKNIHWCGEGSNCDQCCEVAMHLAEIAEIIKLAPNFMDRRRG